MEGEQPKHNWEHRGIKLPYVNGSKFNSWIQVFLSFVVGAMSSAFFLGGKSRDLGDLLSWKGEATTEFRNIDERFKKMDREGTDKSRWIDESQENEITSNRARLLELEHISNQRAEVINVMQGKIERLEGELKNLESNGNK